MKIFKVNFFYISNAARETFFEPRVINLSLRSLFLGVISYFFRIEKSLLAFRYWCHPYNTFKWTLLALINNKHRTTLEVNSHKDF